MKLPACKRREGRCWLGLDKGKPRESVGHKATGPTGISAGCWVAEGQMRDMKHVAYQRDLPNWQASQYDTNEHASGIPILYCGRRSVLQPSTLSARNGYEASSASCQLLNLQTCVSVKTKVTMTCRVSEPQSDREGGAHRWSGHESKTHVRTARQLHNPPSQCWITQIQ